jgi:transposase
MLKHQLDHINYTKNYSARQLVLSLDYGISLEQDRPVCILDAVLERIDYTKLLHLYSAKGRNTRIPPVILFKVIVFAMTEGTYSLRGIAHQCRRTTTQRPAQWV